MTICLDTSVVVEMRRNRKPHSRHRFAEAQAAGDPVRLATLAFHELSYGAMISTRPAQQLAMLDDLVARAPDETWTPEDAVVAARVRADLKRSGLAIGKVDSLIAGQALNRGWPVVTDNIREFIRVDGLIVIDWSDRAIVRVMDAAAWRRTLFREPREE